MPRDFALSSPDSPSIRPNARRRTAAAHCLSSSPPRRWRAPAGGIERLGAGQRLRIQTGHNGRVDGRFARLGSDSLGTQPLRDARYVLLSDAAGSVSIDDIVEVRVRRSSLLAGALIGAAVGGFAGVALGAASDGNQDTGSANGWFTGPVYHGNPTLEGGFAGAVLGATLGALTGLVVPRWQVQYRR